MSKLEINIGQSANDRSGDPLRVAFNKVNANFTELYDLVASSMARLAVSESPTAPPSPYSGELWYDTVGGRLYIYFDSTWVDTNPATTNNIGLSTLKSVVASSTSFTDFQARIAAL